MFVGQIEYKCECVQERLKQCRRMNVLPKVQTIYIFPGYNYGRVYNLP